MARRGSQGLATLVLAAIALAALRTAERGFLPGPSARAPGPSLERSTPGAVTAAAGASAAVLGSLPATAADAGDSGDWFSPFVNLNAGIIEGIDGLVGSAGMAIVLYTIALKIVTWPLQIPALRTSAILQLLSPQIDKIKRDNPEEEKQNPLLRNLYNKVGLNPFSSFGPLLVQLPVFIALFRAVTQLAKQNENFKASFLWIPSLAGPVPVGTNPSLDWLLKTRYSDHFEPLAGWPDAQGYLATVFIVVASQFFLQRLQTSSQDGAASALFPIFIGISCMVSPSGVALYWLTNNVLSAVQVSYVKAQVAEELPEYKKIKDAADAEAAAEGAVNYTRKSPFMEENAELVDSVEKLKPKVSSTKKSPKSKPSGKRQKSPRR